MILGRDWIHANQCVPSSLHQFLIQWVGDNIEIIHADPLAEISIADASIGEAGSIVCLSGRDLSGYEFISFTSSGFVPVSLKLIDNQLNIIV